MIELALTLLIVGASLLIIDSAWGIWIKYREMKDLDSDQ